MPGDGGLGGWLLLSDQLSTDRFLDKLNRNRANAQLAADSALLYLNAEQIIRLYNQLVADFNDLLRRATEVSRDADREDAIIADLQNQAEQLQSAKTALEAENSQLRRENMAQAIRVQWLEDIVRQDRPGYLPDC